MKYLEDKSFFFESSAPGLKPETFTVVNFSGTEAISRLYQFEITLMSTRSDINIEDLLGNPVVFYLRPGKKLPVHGVLSNFEQLHQVDGRTFYRAVLVPRLWQLTLYNVSEVYLDMKVSEIIEQVLKEAGFKADDYQLKLSRTYPKWEFICQYQENHFNFLSRWMEREGIYYYFQQGAKEEKLIITDNRMSHVDNPGEKLVHYSPPSGMETGTASETSALNFISRQKPVPAKVVLQDFNYRLSPPVISGEAVVSQKGKGEVMIYGEHIKSAAEAKEYAGIRAQEILCRQTVYIGETAAAFLRPGWYFSLDKHYRSSFNRKYLLTEVRHAGSQAAFLGSGIAGGLSEEEKRAYYRNTIEAIGDDLQFRPERVTVKPRFHGTINAKVEGDSTGQYAELDSQGRYKVKFPFDRSDKKGQHASRWIRMSQPYAGPNEGMHFPLRKGAEVLLTFMDGDPDRPMIAAAATGAECPSVVNNRNFTCNVISSASGHKLEFDDEDGKERILLSSSGDLDVVVADDRTVEVGNPEDTKDPEKNNRGTPAASLYGNAAGTPPSEIAKLTSEFSFAGIDLSWVGKRSPVQKDSEGWKYASTIISGETIHGSQEIEIEGDLITNVHGCILGGAMGSTVDQTDGDTLEIVKGNSHAYTKGKSYEYCEGDSWSKVVGNSWEMVVGNTVSRHDGTSSDTFNGAASEIFNGASSSIFNGAANEIFNGSSSSVFNGSSYEGFLGVQTSLSLAQCTELYFGNKDELHVGGKGEVKLALALEVFIGIALSVSFALKFTMGTQDIKIAALTCEEKKLEFKTKQVTIKGHTFKIVNGMELKA